MCASEHLETTNYEAFIKAEQTSIHVRVST